MTIIAIEGNIGSGKSKLVDDMRTHFESYAKQRPNAVDGVRFVFLPEPVDVWQTIKDREGKDMLIKFYESPKDYAFAFQMMAYISRLSMLKRAVRENPGAIIVTERSVETDRYVFAKSHYDDGMIEEVEYQIYLRWFDEFIDEIKVDGIMYLGTTPEVAHHRTKQRAREGEEGVTLEYLEVCDSYHEKWLAPMLARARSYATNTEANTEAEAQPKFRLLDGDLDLALMGDAGRSAMLSDLYEFCLECHGVE